MSAEAVKRTAIDYVEMKETQKPLKRIFLFSYSALKPNEGINPLPFCCLVQVSGSTPETQKRVKRFFGGHIPAERALQFQPLCFSVSLCFKLLIIFALKFYVHKVYNRISFNASVDGGLYSSNLLNSSVKTQNVK